MAGVKTRIGVIGHDGRAILDNCTSSLNNKIDSILQWAHKAGKSVGIVTTTRITHATPAGAYAHIANRGKSKLINSFFLQKIIKFSNRLGSL